MDESNQTLMPSLCVNGGAAAIDFYKRAFGAKERYRLEDNGKIAHAELELQGAVFALADEYPDYQFVGPHRFSGTSVSLHVYVPDVDAFAARAADGGATIERPVRDEFYGDRVVSLRDPFGHRWSFRTRKEKLTNDEIAQRFSKLMAGG